MHGSKCLGMIPERIDPKLLAPTGHSRLTLVLPMHPLPRGAAVPTGLSPLILAPLPLYRASHNKQASKQATLLLSMLPISPSHRLNFYPTLAIFCIDTTVVFWILCPCNCMCCCVSGPLCSPRAGDACHTSGSGTDRKGGGTTLLCGTMDSGIGLHKTYLDYRNFLPSSERPKQEIFHVGLSNPDLKPQIDLGVGAKSGGALRAIFTLRKGVATGLICSCQRAL